MSKYCPVCFGEFKNKLDLCPKDQVRLLDGKPREIEKLVDIYVTAGEIEAERIIAFLQDAGIDARESLSGISQMPTASDTRYAVAVMKEQAKLAKEIIARAQTDGVISKNGNFV